MSSCICDNNHLTNYILLGTDIEQLNEQAKSIVKESVVLCPNAFSGVRTAFPYEFRYVPPFDKSFGELKRLQGTAAVNAGRRSEYKGYILIDVNNYLRHESEEYFDKAMKFLSDSNDCWKYIFLVDCSNSKPAFDLVAKILSSMHCKVLEDNHDKNKLASQYIENIVESMGIMCTTATKIFFEEVLINAKASREIVKTILKDIADRKGYDCTIDMQSLEDYFNFDVPVIRYMISKEQYGEIVLIYKRVKEKGIEHDEKI